MDVAYALSFLVTAATGTTWMSGTSGKTFVQASILSSFDFAPWTRLRASVVRRVSARRQAVSASRDLRSSSCSAEAYGSRASTSPRSASTTRLSDGVDREANPADALSPHRIEPATVLMDIKAW